MAKIKRTMTEQDVQELKKIQDHPGLNKYVDDIIREFNNSAFSIKDIVDVLLDELEAEWEERTYRTNI